MSNVQECVRLYLNDDHVSDAQFRAVIEDAAARDLIDGNEEENMHELLANHGRSLVLLNRLDDLRRDQLDAIEKEVRKLTGYVDSLTGQLRVMRERMDEEK